MKRGGVLIGVLLLMCIAVLLFFLFSSSITRSYGLSRSRMNVGKVYYNTEAAIRGLDTDVDNKTKLEKILADNMMDYTGRFQRTKLYHKEDFSDDWNFYLYPDPESSNFQHFLDVVYHQRSDGAHCELTGAFAFENPAFFSKIGILDAENLPKGYDKINPFIEECCQGWTEYCTKISPKKLLKDIRAARVAHIYQKIGSGYHLCKYMGSEGEHSCGLEAFDAHCSLNTVGEDSKFTTETTKTDVFFEGVENGFPRKDPTVLFGTYVIDGDLYVNTETSIYGILIMKGGRIFCSEGSTLNVYGLLISELPMKEAKGCNVQFDLKYLLREAVTLPNFLNVELIGIRE